MSIRGRTPSLFGAMLAPSWLQLGHLGSNLGSCWLHLGSNLAILAPTWGHVGSILAPSWPSWFQLGHLGAILGHVRLHLGVYGLILSVVGTSKIVKNCGVFEVFQYTPICLPMLAYLGLWWRIFAYLGAILAPSWAPTWPSWLHLGALLGHVRLLLGASWLI